MTTLLDADQLISAREWESALNPIRKEMHTMKHFIKQFVQEESGADMLEYALVLTLVALACVAGLTKLGSSIGSALNTTANAVTSSL